MIQNMNRNYGPPPFIIETVTLRPNWIQYVITEFPAILIWIASLLVFLFATFTYHRWFFWVWVITSAYLFFRMLYLARIEYIITAEQIIIMGGVMSHNTDYVELYRVVDYKQRSSFFQQMFGLKNVIIYSGDRNNPELEMIGLKANEDIVSIIRYRVEYNRQLKRIYEFSNQS
ncbi:MAG: PH domain-containing protein [Prevotellaceae bacterium]|nr:PH domain-containing protein [Prevotellaceae bacterium]